MKPTFSRSIDTTLLLERLAKCQEGETITYADLSACIKRDVQGAARQALRSAIHIALAEHQMVFGTVQKIGVKRLNATESVEYASSSVNKIHREARRGAKRVAAAEYEKLDQSGKQKHNATAAILSAMAECTKANRVKLVEKAVENKHKLAVAETLAALSG